MISWILNAPLNRFLYLFPCANLTKRPNESERSTVHKLETERTSGQALDAKREPNSSPGIEKALVMRKSYDLSWRSTRNKLAGPYDGKTPKKNGRKNYMGS